MGAQIWDRASRDRARDDFRMNLIRMNLIALLWVSQCASPVIDRTSRPAACKVRKRALRGLWCALFSQQETNDPLIQQPDQNSLSFAPYSLHDRPQYRVGTREADAG
jgi:hypothetical protein